MSVEQKKAPPSDIALIDTLRNPLDARNLIIGPGRKLNIKTIVDKKPVLIPLPSPPSVFETAAQIERKKSGLEWTENEYIYHIYPKSFAIRKGRTRGDLPGINERMDYIKDLGATAFWLGPVMDSPENDNGYDTSSYFKVNPELGNRKDLKEVLESAHARGLKVVLDLVVNHTSDKHPLFEEARKSKDNPYRDMYVWADPSGYELLSNGDRVPKPPNNWVSFFNAGVESSAWTYDDKTEQFYLHKFDETMPDLNPRHELFPKYVESIMRSYFEMGADGIRVDAGDIQFFEPDLTKEKDMELNPDYDKDKQDPINKYKWRDRYYSHNETYALFRKMSTVAQDYGGMVVIESGDNKDHMADMYGANVIPTNFSIAGLLEQDRTVIKQDPYKIAAGLKQEIDSFMKWLPEGKIPTFVANNHDKFAMLIQRVGAENIRNMLMVLTSLPGHKYLYNFDEIGLQPVEGSITPENTNDPQGKLLGQAHNRDNSRVPPPWGDMLESTSQLWLPQGSAFGGTIQEQIANPESLLNCTIGLIKTNKSLPAMQRLGYGEVDDLPKGVLAFDRVEIGQTVRVITNWTGEEKTINLPPGVVAKLIRTTNSNQVQEYYYNEKIKLEPNSGVSVELIKL